MVAPSDSGVHFELCPAAPVAHPGHSGNHFVADLEVGVLYRRRIWPVASVLVPLLVASLSILTGASLEATLSPKASLPLVAPSPLEPLLTPLPVVVARCGPATIRAVACGGPD